LADERALIDKPHVGGTALELSLHAVERYRMISVYVTQVVTV